MDDQIEQSAKVDFCNDKKSAAASFADSSKDDEMQQKEKDIKFCAISSNSGKYFFWPRLRTIF